MNQRAWNKSTGKQFNGKLQYQYDGGKIVAFADLSRTNQADDPYLSKDMLSRLGWYGSDGRDGFGFLGILSFALGAGFLISAFAAVKLSRRFGLIASAAASEE